MPVKPDKKPLTTDESVCLWEWKLTTDDPVGEPIRIVERASVTVQAVGKEWPGCTAQFQGSLNGKDFAVLSCRDGWSPLSFTRNTAPRDAAQGALEIRPALAPEGHGAEIVMWALVRKVRG